MPAGSKINTRRRSYGYRGWGPWLGLWLILLLVSGTYAWKLTGRLFNTPYSPVLESASGDLLGATVAKDGQWRFPGRSDIPPRFAACLLTFEDKRFFWHHGVDPIALSRAAILNFRQGTIVSGGSTITMQVVRLSGKQPRTYLQKLKEAVLATLLELRYNKREILSLYAAQAPFGGNVVGLEAASWRYFGRSPAQLSWGETAALAVLPNAPSLVHPGKNQKQLLRKRNQLLSNLWRAGFIDSVSYRLSMEEPLPGTPRPIPQLAPHLLQEMIGRHSKDSGLPPLFRSTINSRLQEQVNQVLELHHQQLKGNGIQNAAVLVVEVETGKVLAYNGNIFHPDDPSLESQVDIIPSRRSPGSTLKPLLYAAALSDGTILPNTLLPDIPVQIGSYTPKNFDEQYDGAVPAALALSRSLNIPALKLLQQYKVPRFYDVLRKSGISTLDRSAGEYGLSLVLGGCEISIWDMAGVYASMARALKHQHLHHGKILSADFFPPRFTVQEYQKDRFSQNHPNSHPDSSNEIHYFDLPSIWFMFQAMQDVMRPGEEQFWQAFSSSQRIAWKTGTSFGFRDGWAIGVSPGYVVCAWAGNADGEGRPGLTGLQTAAPILFDVFRLLPATGWFAEPAYGYTILSVCHETGFRAGPDCNHIDTVWVPLNGNKTVQCPYHIKVHLDASGSYQVSESCYPPSQMTHESWFVLPPAMEWFYRRNHFDYRPLPVFREGCGSETGPSRIALLYPLQNARIYVPLEKNGKKGMTVFKATHRDPTGKLFWHLDDHFIGETFRFHELALNPSPGYHVLTLVDEQGETITRSFEILDDE